MANREAFGDDAKEWTYLEVSSYTGVLMGSDQPYVTITVYTGVECRQL